jgi:hypothetical protein
MDAKGFTTLGPGALACGKDLKLFSLSLTKKLNKMEGLSWASFLQPGPLI